MEILPLIDAAAAAKVAAGVRALSAHWFPRSGEAFHTLGAASYLDAVSGFTPYSQRAAVSNPLLLGEFGWLLDCVDEALETRVGAAVHRYAPLAVAGFHVFRPGPQPARASAHFDKQFELIEWGSAGPIEPASQLSFTLPVELPASGGGLDLFDLFSDELEPLSFDERIEVCKERRVPKPHEYEVGTLVVHSGRQLHRIRSFNPGDDSSSTRITLQGHVIRTSSGWISYW